jgi:hypothetical protein
MQDGMSHRDRDKQDQHGVKQKSKKYDQGQSEKIMNKTEKLRNSRAYGTRAHETPNIGTPTKSRTIK